MTTRNIAGRLAETGQSIVIAGLILLVTVVFFLAYLEVAYWLLETIDYFEADTWDLALGWYGIGLIGAFYWPLRHYKNMQGSWGSALEVIPGLALFGPLAFIAGLPL